jgi:cell division septal protein FtsQ
VTDIGDHSSDWEPDQAALDELERAFGVDRKPEPAALADTESADAGNEISVDPVGRTEEGLDEENNSEATIEELFIVEQDPMPEPVQNVIRIDDYVGSTPVEPMKLVDDTTPDEALALRSSSSLDVETSAVEVIAIDDTDSPDAVYVEGSLDPDRTRTIVFIEDDDTGDSLVPESARDLRRGIDPRLRERRVAIKRARGRRRFKWLILTLVVVCVAVGTLALLGSSLFAIRSENVELTGNVYTNTEQLDAIVEDLVGTPVLRVDTRDAERRIEAIPWVDTVKVQTRFPHTVKIEIKEREAMATYQGPDTRFRVLDREGRVLDVIDAYPVAYLLLGGPDAINLDPGELAPTGYAAASALAKNVTGSIRGQIEIVEVAADGSSLVMRLNDGTEVRFGEARDLFVKLVRLETVLSSTEDREPGVINVSTREVTL